MTRQENVVNIAARLYQIRETARRLLGEDYGVKLHPYRQIVKAAMIKHGVDELEAAERVIVDLQAHKSGSEWAQLFIAAAAVEMVEPSEERGS